MVKKASGFINRELFSPYIDWNRFDEAAAKINSETDFIRLYMMLSKKTRLCLDIEQVLADADCF